MLVMGVVQVMLSFYGLVEVPDEVDEDGQVIGLIVTLASDFDDKKDNWLNRFNHNHLRLTRIMKSLTILGLSKRARALHAVLMWLNKQYPKAFHSVTIDFWNEAIKEQRLPVIRRVILSSDTIFSYN